MKTVYGRKNDRKDERNAERKDQKIIFYFADQYDEYDQDPYDYDFLYEEKRA